MQLHVLDKAVDVTLYIKNRVTDYPSYTIKAISLPVLPAQEPQLAQPQEPPSASLPIHEAPYETTGSAAIGNT